MVKVFGFLRDFTLLPPASILKGIPQMLVLVTIHGVGLTSARLKRMR